MHIVFVVEEPSMEELLRNGLAPKLLGQHTYNIIDFGGKQRLLAGIENRLKAYAAWPPDDYRFLITVDEDRQDCHALKARIEKAAENAGLPTRSVAAPDHKVVVRIVVEELEAWLLGDPNALRAAYPKLSPTFECRANYRA